MYGIGSQTIVAIKNPWKFRGILIGLSAGKGIGGSWNSFQHLPSLLRP